MANWDEYKDILVSIRKEWDKAEEDIKRAEQACNEVVFPSIKELRYAGRRLVEILYKIDSNAPNKDIDNLFSDAVFDCHRARHDAIDAATAKIAIDLNIAAKKLGYDTILKVFPKFPQMFQMLNETRQKIVASRGKRNDREAIYSVLEKDTFPVLLDVFYEFQASESIMLQIAKKQRLHRVLTYGIGVIAVVAGILVGIFT